MFAMISLWNPADFDRWTTSVGQVFTEILYSLDSKPPPESKPPSKVSTLFLMHF